MALIRPGGGVASISGSIGGTTFARNRGGSYARNRTVPIDPGSSFQSLVRSLMSGLANVWAETLTEAQRSAWDSYAEAVPLPNPLGESRNVGGVGMYVRGNLIRGQVGYGDLPRVDAGPVILALSAYTPPGITGISETTQQIAYTFDNTDEWANEDDAGMAVYVSRPQNPGVNFFKGPYRYAGVILGNGTTPPTSPASIDLPFTAQVGQRIFVRTNVVRADGRAGSDFRLFGTVS